LRGDLVEAIPDLPYRLRIEFIEGFAAGAEATHDADTLEHAKVLGDGLAREVRAFSQL
jgi:hypothetical protein